MNSQNLQHQALLEVVGPKVLAEWMTTVGAVKTLIIGKLKSEVDENNMVPKVQVTAAITVLSQTVASLIRIVTSDAETRDVLKNAFSQGVDYWLEAEDKEASV